MGERDQEKGLGSMRPLPILMAFSAFFLSSCVHGPDTKKKSLAESLNGRNYETVGASNILGTPMVHRRRANTQISGQIFLDEKSGMFTPLANQHLLLIREEKAVAETRSDTSGAFVFSADIPDGAFSIQLDSKRFTVDFPIQITGFELRGLQLYASQKN